MHSFFGVVVKHLFLILPRNKLRTYCEFLKAGRGVENQEVAAVIAASKIRDSECANLQKEFASLIPTR
jgi:hypothetical protein